MKIRFWNNDNNFTAGMTLKDSYEPEHNNMALHICSDGETIVDNRKRLARQIHCNLGDFVCPNQTHSANFHKVTQSDRGRGSNTVDTAIYDTDALYTFEPNILLCCFTADCVPVILVNEKTGLIGIIHSGWQGTVKEITPKLLKHLTEYEQCDPADIKIYIGPALSCEKFKVDGDVAERYYALGYADDFIAWDRNHGKGHIDNQLVVKEQCKRHGIEWNHIKIDRTCTYQREDCFSYRQDKLCGRHLHFIMRRGDPFK
jgi:YfiH family protein